VETVAKERALITTALLLLLLLLGEVGGELRVEDVLVVVVVVVVDVVELAGEGNELTELMSEPLRDRVGLLRTEAYL
jgi:hypothetical protein